MDTGVVASEGRDTMYRTTGRMCQSNLSSWEISSSNVLPDTPAAVLPWHGVGTIEKNLSRCSRMAQGPCSMFFARMHQEKYNLTILGGKGDSAFIE